MKAWKICVLLFYSSQAIWAQRSTFDTINFENTVHLNRLYFDSTQSSGIWQIGRPQKPLFDSAYSGDFAIITDTTLNYIGGSADTFGFGFEIFGVETSIEFKHRFDLDSLKAFGNLEISVDSGNTWHLLHDTIDSFNFMSQIGNNLGVYGTSVYNFYPKLDTSLQARNGFTGNSNGWISSLIQFPCYAIKKPWEIYLRFNFSADSSAIAGEGWMIDDIMISSYGDCSGFEENALVNKVEIFPNPSFGDEIKISIPWEETIDYRIYSSTGQLVQRGNLPPFEQSIPLKFSRTGLYSLFFSSQQQVVGSALLLKP